MKNKQVLTFLFFLLQFGIVYWFKWNGIAYFLLAESFLLYLLIKQPYPFIVLLFYFLLIPSVAFQVLLFIVLFHFLNSKIKVSVKVSVVFFLILYFFTARYETYLIKAVMPGFIAFASIIYAITRMPFIQKGLGNAVFIYTVAGFFYSIFFNAFSYFRSEPYLMFSIDVIQLVIALTVYSSLKGYLEEESPDSEQEHNKGNA